MVDMDEFLEFGEPEIAEKAEEAYYPSPAKANSSHSVGQEPSKREKILASLCQYTSVGGGYIPTHNTVKTLEPDCYTITMTMEGQTVFVPQKIVTDNLMRLPDSKSDAVIAEVENFWPLKTKFKEFGFSHKRGFLLWGPPGSGKTSTIQIVISDMIKKGGIVLLAEHPQVLAKALMQFRAIEPERPLVVIWEDIDTIIHNFGESQVLSVLDGEAQVENVVFIATTNYPERLDGRVRNRPSRFDKVVKIGLPNDAAREMYLKTKLPSTTLEGFDLVKETDGLSIAHLKELLISVCCQGNTVKDSLERLQSMKRPVASDSEHSPMGFGLGAKK
jgi:AAA+ superfamily predicted ATPase